MVKVRWNLVGIGVVIILSLLLLPWLISLILGFNIFQILPIYSFPIMLLGAIFLVVASFLPYAWAKALVNISYACIFLSLIIMETALLKPYVERVGGINLERCSEESFYKFNEVNDLLRIVGCVITGYEIKDYKIFSIASFWLFYIILPAFFLGYFTYGLLNGLELNKIFGNVSNTVTKVISFITALYGVNLMFGPFLLYFFAAGVWGIVGVFFAGVLTAGLRKVVERFFVLEKQFEEVKKVVETAKQAKEKLYELPLINNIRVMIMHKLDPMAINAALEDLRNKAQILIPTIEDLKVINAYIDTIKVYISQGDRNHALVALNDLVNYLKPEKAKK